MILLIFYFSNIFLQEKKAKELTELVDKAGRAIVKVGDYKECRKIVSI